MCGLSVIVLMDMTKSRVAVFEDVVMRTLLWLRLSTLFIFAWSSKKPHCGCIDWYGKASSHWLGWWHAADRLRQDGYTWHSSWRSHPMDLLTWMSWLAFSGKGDATPWIHLCERAKWHQVVWQGGRCQTTPSWGGMGTCFQCRKEATLRDHCVKNERTFHLLILILHAISTS